MIDAEDCTMLALTMYKEDFDEDTWLDLTTKTFPTVKRLLAKDHLELQSTWGKSLRDGRAPASPHQAKSLQVHGMLATSKLDDFLRKTGYNHIFCTPKLPSGRLSTDFKVVWTKVSQEHPVSQSAAIPGCLGLVKGKNTIGFRVRNENYDKAWEALNPGEPLPTKHDGALIYKILGLPFGVTMSMMQQWLDAVPWKASPFKALGPTGYLVRSTGHPPQGIHLFNGSPVLIQFLPNKDERKSPIVLGPKGASSSTSSDFMQQPGGDPWAGAKLPAPQQRQTTGPVEQRFQEQDDKIASLQVDMQKLLKSQESNKAETQQQLTNLEQRTGEQFAVVNQNMEQMRKEFDRSLQISLQQNTQLMDDRMQDLKQWLQESNQIRPAKTKRKPEKTESDMDSDN